MILKSMNLWKYRISINFPVCITLILISAVNFTQSIDPVESEFGADQESDLVVEDDDYVSGSHAWLCYTDGSFIIVDQNSRNGTWLNDKQVSAKGANLRPGDRIQFGRSTFEIERVKGRNDPK
jgi:pSer/pThr/pTyr-binding forkhead associated (FHA) protein